MLYRFADCLLNTDLHTIERAGQRLPLPPKVFAVLLYLLEHRERVVSKHELCVQVWLGLAISEATLESCGRDVRRALGDRGQRHRIIQTQRGYGYRFVAEVTQEPVWPLPSQGGKEQEATGVPGDAGCQVCQNPNPAGATFCMTCGARLRQPCTRCGGVVEASATPCPACGESGSAAVPSGWSLPIHALAGDGEERKPVTVLCCGVTPGEAPGECSALTTLHRRMHVLQAMVREVVPAYGGQVHAVLGDRLLVLFGVPTAREDDARRAVQAALALRQQCQTRPGDPVLLQMGLHTGPVVVDGSQAAAESPATVVGEVLSVAMALQEQATPGQLLCSATTTRLLYGTVRLARGQPVTLRGQSVPLTVHAILGPRVRWHPRRRTLGRRLSPFVGRQRELATLHAL